jgi:hypothetical protein
MPITYQYLQYYQGWPRHLMLFAAGEVLHASVSVFFPLAHTPQGSCHSWLHHRQSLARLSLQDSSLGIDDRGKGQEWLDLLDQSAESAHILRRNCANLPGF